MDIRVSRTLYMSCQAGPGIEPGPSALKASALPIELTWQTTIVDYYSICDEIDNQSDHAPIIMSLKYDIERKTIPH